MKKRLGDLSSVLFGGIFLFVFVFSFFGISGNVPFVWAAPLNNLSDLDRAWYFAFDLNGGTWEEETEAANSPVADLTQGGDVRWIDIGGAMDDRFYIGSNNEFRSIHIHVTSTEFNLDVAEVGFEYWDSQTESWEVLDFTSTSPSQDINDASTWLADGIWEFDFDPPANWGVTSTQGDIGIGDNTERYYIRFNCQNWCFVSVYQISIESTNQVPSLAFRNEITQATDGSGHVSVPFTSTDNDGDNIQFSAQYKVNEGGECTNIPPFIGFATLTESGMENIEINNAAEDDYRVATSSGNGIVVWDTQNSTGTQDVEEDYCLVLTPYDGVVEGESIVGDVSIDNLAPVSPDDMIETSSIGVSSVVLSLDATSTDTNFAEYKIYYASSSEAIIVDEEDTLLVDANVDFTSSTFAGAETTTLSGLTVSTSPITYYANIFAYDDFGNVASSTQINFETKAIPVETNFANASTTDFSEVEDINAVENLTLATDDAKVIFSNALDAEAKDFDTNVRMANQFVAVDAATLDYANEPAIVSMSVDTCEDVNFTIYYKENFPANAAEVTAEDQVCDAESNPSCTNVACVDNTLSFTISHFTGFAVVAAAVENNVVEENNNNGGGGGGSVLIHSNPPVATAGEDASFVINDDDVYTTEQAVILNMNVDNAEQMAFSLNEDFAGSSFVSYEGTAPFMLAQEAGMQTVYARFRAANGSVLTLSDEINYQATDEALLEDLLDTLEEELAENDVLDESDGEALLEEFIAELDNEVFDLGCRLDTALPYRTASRPGVYRVLEEEGICVKKVFKTGASYLHYFDSWNQVQVLDASVNEELLDLPFAAIPYVTHGERLTGETVLVKRQEESNVYLVEGNLYRWIANADVFFARGYEWSDVVDVDEFYFLMRDEGEAITE